jgi:hypothetical protein
MAVEKPGSISHGWRWRSAEFRIPETLRFFAWWIIEHEKPRSLESADSALPCCDLKFRGGAEAKAVVLQTRCSGGTARGSATPPQGRFPRHRSVWGGRGPDPAGVELALMRYKLRAHIAVREGRSRRSISFNSGSFPPGSDRIHRHQCAGCQASTLRHQQLVILASCWGSQRGRPFVADGFRLILFLFFLGILSGIGYGLGQLG